MSSVSLRPGKFYSSAVSWAHCEMPSLNLLVVGQEKELNDFEEALEGCKRYVGPLKLFSAHKAVDAVGRLQVTNELQTPLKRSFALPTFHQSWQQLGATCLMLSQQTERRTRLPCFLSQKLIQTCGTCHAAFLSNHFTAPGKEEFSDTLRKVLKEKYADVPVVCWGNPKKGGDLNKHFHATVVSARAYGAVLVVLVLSCTPQSRWLPTHAYLNRQSFYAVWPAGLFWIRTHLTTIAQRCMSKCANVRHTTPCTFITVLLLNSLRCARKRMLHMHPTHVPGYCCLVPGTPLHTRMMGDTHMRSCV